MIHGRRIQDAELSATKALPNGAVTVTTDPIEIHSGASKTAHVAPVIAQMTYPSLGASALPDTKTMTYTIEHSDSIDSGYTELSPNAVQTGADGAGAAGNSVRIALPDNVKRYIRAKAVNTGTGNASGSSFTLELLF